MTSSLPILPYAPPRNDDTSALLGIDVGGTKMLGGIVSRGGEVLFHHQQPTRRGNLLDDIVSLADLVLAAASRLGVRLAGTGVGTTGFVDRPSGTLVRSLNLGIAGIPIGRELAARSGLPVHVDNDVHAATLGEICFGAGRRHHDFLLYNAGTGLATGMVFNRRLYRGASNAAGENGHISSDQSGATLSPGGMSGEIERLLLDTRAGKPTISAYLPRIEPPAKKEYGYLALNLIQLVNLMNPAAIVLAGGMFSGDPVATEWVRRAVHVHALPIAVDGLREMALSRTAPFTGLVGAAALVIEAESLLLQPEP